MNQYAKVVRLVAACVAAAGLAWAGSAVGGATTAAKITHIMTSGGGANFVLIYTDTAPTTAAAACATQTSAAGSYRWAMDPSTEAGRAGVANAMLAYSLGKSIQISGTGACTILTDTETVSFIATL